MYIKVVKVVDDKLVSEWATHQLQRTYSKDFWTIADSKMLEIGLGLFCYKTVDPLCVAARYRYGMFEIWKCDIANQLPIKMIKPRVLYDILNCGFNIKTFIEDPENCRTYIPRDAVMVDSLILTERLF